MLYQIRQRQEFAKTFNGKVFLCYYAEKQKGAAKWNEHDWIVSVDRTESLNDSTRAVHEQRVSIPRRDDDEIKLFARHCHNIARKKEEDKDSGSVRQIWIRTGADHYRHSLNYLWLALKEIGNTFLPNLMGGYHDFTGEGIGKPSSSKSN
jgi:hypothetical protein